MVSTPWVGFLPAAESVAMARLNDAAAEVARANPGRFGTLATLLMRDPEAALAEIAHCLDDLVMNGVCMMSNVHGRHPGHESFATIFDELNRRRAVIHPTDAAHADTLGVASVAERPLTRAAIDLIYSGTIRCCPNTGVILAHAGGALPGSEQPGRRDVLVIDPATRRPCAQCTSGATWVTAAGVDEYSWVSKPKI